MVWLAIVAYCKLTAFLIFTSSKIIVKPEPITPKKRSSIWLEISLSICVQEQLQPAQKCNSDNHRIR
jgi:hypothetical protein